MTTRGVLTGGAAEVAEVAEVSDETFANTVLRAGRPVLVDFGAPWCPPCLAMTPVLKTLAAEYDGRVDVVTLNADDNPATIARYGVLGLPTFMVFRDGAEAMRLVGARPAAALRQVLDGVLGNT